MISKVCSPVLLEEILIFFVLERIKLVQVFVLQSVLVRPSLGFDQSFLDERFGVFWFLRNNSMLTENVVPVQSYYIRTKMLVTTDSSIRAGKQNIASGHRSRMAYHSVSSLGLTSTSIASVVRLSIN